MNTVGQKLKEYFAYQAVSMIKVYVTLTFNSGPFSTLTCLLPYTLIILNMGIMGQ